MVGSIDEKMLENFDFESGIRVLEGIIVLS